MTVLPNGGHLGFIASDWLLVKSLRIFGKRVKRPELDLDETDNRTREQARKEAVDAAKEALKRDVPPPDKKK